MRNKISKSNADWAYFSRRLDEIPMSAHERARAKAHFARAEAVAAFLADAARAIGRLFKDTPARPNRPAASAG